MTIKRRHIRMARAAWRVKNPMFTGREQVQANFCERLRVVECVLRWHSAANGRKA